jgi:hypothetical protein
MNEFESLMDKHKDREAWILGKGPSLDLYKEKMSRGCVIIGVNNVGNYHRVHYSITTDGFAKDAYGKAEISQLTALPHRGGFSHKKDDIWFLHCDDMRSDGYAGRLSKEQVSTSRWLYTCSSSAQPAVHLAWYMGCTKIHMIGIDGGVGYAEGLPRNKRDPGQTYDDLLIGTLRIANLCFGKNWHRLTREQRK